MTINEAIKALSKCTYGNNPAVDESGWQAILLGIEALKAIKHQRDKFHYRVPYSLYGETEE